MCVCVCVCVKDEVLALITRRATRALMPLTAHGRNYAPASANDSSACCNCAGNALPRFAARRRIPAAAFQLKKYFRRCGPGLSKLSDKEHTTATLGHSVVLSVQNPVAVAQIIVGL